LKQRPTLMFGDQHVFPLSSFSSMTDDGSTSVIHEHEKTFTWIGEQIRLHKPVMVVNMGDAAHNFGNLDSLTLRCLYEGYQTIHTACEQVDAKYYQLLGNHDFENEAKRIHCFPFVHVRELVTDTMCTGDGDLFVPFYRDPEQITETVAEALVENPNIKRAFIHIDCIGALMNAFMMPSKKGVDPAIFNGIRTFAGHYHHPQTLGDITVVGSTGYRSFSDCVIDTPRGIVLDLPGKKIKRIENPHTSIYFSAEIENVKDLKDIPEYVDKSRTYFRIKYPEAMPNQPALAKALAEFQDVRVVPIPTPKESAVVSPISGKATPQAVITQYINANPPDDLPVAHVLAYAENLLADVSEDTVAFKGKAVRIAGLKIRNFLPIGQVELMFDQAGVCYVDGRIDGMEASDSNGAGKSSVFEALYWCLFDDLIREGSADDVVNSQAESNCRVDVTLYIDDDEYIVTRMRKDAEKGNYCSVAMNGEIVSEGLEQTNVRIIQILGCDKTIFKHTTFLVDTLETRFTHINQKQRVQLLESILMTEVYGELASGCHNLLRDAQSTAQITTDKVNTTDSHIALMETTLENIVSERKALTEKRKAAVQKLRQQIEENEKKLSEYRKDLTVKQRMQDKMLNTAVDLNLIKERAEDDVDLQQSLCAKVLLQQERLQEEAEALEEKRKAAKKTGVCPYCGAKPAHAIDWSQIDKLKAKLKGMTDTIADFTKTIAVATMNADKATKAHSEHMTKMRTLKDEIFRIKTQSEDLPSRIKSYWDQLNLTDREKATDAEVKLKQDIVSAHKQLAQMRNSLIQTNVEIAVYAYLEQVFGPKGCRLWVLNDAVTALGSLVLDNIEFLSRGQVRADMAVDDKGISLQVGKVRSSGELSKNKYGMASSGERRKVDIGIQLAMSVLSSLYSGFRCNVMFLDEVDDKIDGASRQRLVELLEKVAVDNQQSIFIASHYKEIRSMTTRTMTMLNRDGVSELLMEQS
jgi:hypothetical protein